MMFCVEFAARVRPCLMAVGVAAVRVVRIPWVLVIASPIAQKMIAFLGCKD